MNNQDVKTTESKDLHYMHLALNQARKAMALGEVPIGCIITCDGKIIGRGYNRRNTDHSVFSHAEMSAIRKACRKLGDWRLENCTIYITLEPCQMCAGAIVQSRIDRVVIGARSPKSGCGGTVIDILSNNEFDHKCEVSQGVLESDCSSLLKEFFRELRKRNKESKASQSN